LFGYSADEAVGQPITLVIPSDRLPEEADILLRLSRGERIDHFETVRQRKDGSFVDVSLTISPVRDSQGKIVGASKIARDISARRQAERAIGRGVRQQKALFRLADELNRAASLDHVYSAALNAILDALHCNRASILLYDDEGIMRFQRWRGLSSAYRDAVDGHSAWKRDDPNPQPFSINNIETADTPESLKAAVKKEGIAALAFIPLVSRGKLIGKFMTYFNSPHHFSEQEIELSLTIARQLSFAIVRQRNEEALRNSEARLRTLSESLDTEVLRQTEQVRNLSYELLRTQDEERKHIARELHDSAGQTLAALSICVALLDKEMSEVEPKSTERLDELKNLVQQLNREIRTMSYLLHPPLLDVSGLSSALNWYLEGLTERSGIDVTLDVAEGIGRLPADMELAIFRLVQECLTNIHRHSGSKTAIIRLVRAGVDFRVEVSDQGSGISPERLSDIQSGRSGLGIRGMQERLRRFGGTLNIESNGAGARIIANIPIPKEVSHNVESVHTATG
jgi:PAS domain S-box-containing protein